jgi:pimeloyl-ACP methyl ester carboxylesterase
MLRPAASLAAFFLALAAAHAQFVPADKPAPLRHLSNAARARFGTITVSENRANPTRMIQLAVIIVPAQTATPKPDPVFYIVGGPGGSATLSSGGFPIFDKLNLERDIVFVDPRGAGFSEPSLYMRRDGVTIGQFTNRNRAFFASQGIDLSAYNTSEIAQDYEAARVALGYGQINLVANSYGTFVAQEMLRRFPGSLRAVVMGGNSPATDPFLPTSLAIERDGIEALLADVARTPAARRAFPNLRQRFYKLMERLNADPVRLRLANRDTGKKEGVTIDGQEFLDTIVGMLQRSQTMRYIPLMVRQLERREYGGLVARFFAPTQDLRRDNPFGMYLSVLGTDFAAPGYVRATTHGTLSVRNRALVRTEAPLLVQLSQLVVAWGVPYAPGTTRTLPHSSVPTFLMNGRMDAQTPVTGGATIAAGLSNATNYVYPRSGHAVGIVEGPALDAAMEFITDPTHAPRYALANLRRPHFYAVSEPVAKSRGVDDWRDHLVDPPLWHAWRSPSQDAQETP